MAIQNFFLLLFISTVHARTDCPTSYCDQNHIAIQYPFWLQSQQTENSCGPQGFNLSCNSQKRAILNMPNSGEFYVNSIYYYIQKVILHDPDNCLPRRLISLNLSASPFMAVSYQNYTFLSCPKGRVSSISAINCLSNTSHDVLAKDEEYVMDSMCEKMFTLPVPVSTFYDYGFPRYLELTWDVSTCKDCVSTTGSTDERPVIRIIALSFFIPALVIPAVIVCISCCICMLKRENPDQPGDSIHISGGAALSAGLDKSTIESFRKITIDESSCIEGPNDITCTICLADYAPEDTIRFMPECEHCFHVECIDKWLSMNSMCPICRGSQSRNNSC